MSRRIVLAPSSTRADFHDSALEHGWQLERVVDAGAENPYEEIWTLGDTRTAVHYIEDALINVPYLLVFGERVDDVAARVSEALETVTAEDAVRATRMARTRAERLRSIAYLAAAAPATVDPEVLAAFEELLADPDPTVRDSAIFGSVYAQWPEIGDLLEHVRAHDAEPPIRQAADDALAAIRRARNGGPG
jgi:hypothetical protein